MIVSEINISHNLELFSGLGMLDEVVLELFSGLLDEVVLELFSGLGMFDSVVLELFSGLGMLDEVVLELFCGMLDAVVLELFSGLGVLESSRCDSAYFSRFKYRFFRRMCRRRTGTV